MQLGTMPCTLSQQYNFHFWYQISFKKVTVWKNRENFLWCKKNNFNVSIYDKIFFGQDSKDSLIFPTFSPHSPIIMLHMYFRLNPHSIFAWKSRNSLLEIGTITEVKWTVQTSTTTQLNHLASSTKWFSVHLRTKWLWVQVLLQSHKQIWCLKWKQANTPRSTRNSQVFTSLQKMVLY